MHDITDVDDTRDAASQHRGHSPFCYLYTNFEDSTNLHLLL